MTSLILLGQRFEMLLLSRPGVRSMALAANQSQRGSVQRLAALSGGTNLSPSHRASPPTSSALRRQIASDSADSIQHRAYSASRYPRGGRFLRGNKTHLSDRRPGAAQPPSSTVAEEHSNEHLSNSQTSGEAASGSGSGAEAVPAQVDPAVYTEAVIPHEPRDVLQQDDPDFEGAVRLLGQSALVVTREIEMMNIFLGYEQANRYSILAPTGELVGYLAEEETGLLGGALQRQLLRTHRPFRATVLNAEGRPVLLIRRPLTWINSKASVFAVRSDYPIASGPPRDQDLRLIGEVQQRWHIYKRRYELFLQRPSDQPSDPADRLQQEHDDGGYFEQFAQIDAGLWSWTFLMHDADEKLVGAIDRNFRGFGRELFTDTGQYVLRFDSVGQTDMTEARLDAPTPSPSQQGSSTLSSSAPTAAEQASSGTALVESQGTRPLTLDERAVALATAVSIDFDYFSRQSSGGPGAGMFPWFYMGGGGGAGGGAGEVTQEGGAGTPSQGSGAGQQDGGFGTGVMGGAMGSTDYPYGPSESGSSDAGFPRQTPPPPPSPADQDYRGGEGSTGEGPWWGREQQQQQGVGQGEEVWGTESSDPWEGANDTQQQEGGWFGSGGGGDGGGGGWGWGDFFPGDSD